MGKTCEDCIHNEDLLCDAKGILVKDDDDACKRWKSKENSDIAKNKEL